MFFWSSVHEGREVKQDNKTRSKPGNKKAFPILVEMTREGRASMVDDAPTAILRQGSDTSPLNL